MIYFKIVIFSIVYLASSSASEKWLSLSSFTELKQLKYQQKKLKKLKLLCYFQLQKQIIPYSCYEWIPLIQTPIQKKLSIPYLNEQCHEFSKSINNLQKISKILQKNYLSPYCYKILHLRKKYLEYQLRDGKLEDVFNWYFK